MESIVLRQLVATLDKLELLSLRSIQGGDRKDKADGRAMVRAIGELRKVIPSTDTTQ